MAYGKKYTHNYCNSEGVACEVSVLEVDYVGAVTELEAGVIPFRKTYSNSSDFKFEPIRASTASVVFVFQNGDEIDFEQFWTADERKFQILHEINNVVDWIGFIIPNGFSYAFTGGLYEGVLTAADGLATLNDIPFAFNSNLPYGTTDLVYNNGFEFPFSLQATEILRKLELDLDTWISVDVYERTMNPAAIDRFADPLSASYTNVKTYINDSSRNDIPYWRDAQEVMNCRTVLENLCYIWGAKVYQSEGAWRIKRVNIDADYGAGVTQRYWHKYNTASVYLGKEVVDKEVFINCATVSKALIGTDHLLSMDEVYSAFRINYDYTFVRDGDNPISLVKNGSFANWTPSSKFDAPPEWYRWRYRSDLFYLGAKPVTIPETDAGGFTTGIEIGTQPTGFTSGDYDRSAKRWSSIRATNEIDLVKGDTLSLSIWQKTQEQFSDPRAHAVSMLYRIRLETPFGKVFFLRNDPSNAEYGLRSLSWVETDEVNKNNSFINSTTSDVFFWLRGGIGQAVENDDIQPINTNGWRRFEMILQDVPETGNATFDLVGTASRSMPTSKFNPSLKVYDIGFNGNEVQEWGPVRTEFFNSGAAARPQVTGISFGKIPNAADQPESQDYVYENTTGRYSLQVDPITILNGDTQDVDHISNIIVPSNVGTGKNFWDTIDNKYGLSSLGLITCKSIMNLYIKPFRLLEGTIKASGLTMDTRIELEALPGRFFSILSGTFNEKKNYLEDVTLFEISNIAIADGGREGENTTDPVYVDTGNFLCVKDFSGLNTGIVGYEQRDVNPNSETYQQVDFRLTPIDVALCPIGDPAQFYFGTDGLVLAVANLEQFPLFTSLEGGTGKLIVQNQISNPGGEYIYFVHLQSLGLVESVFTDAQDEVVSDFQYLADIFVDGFLYKVLRQDYVTADFQNLNINYKFS
jgi:hypothetical protein